MTGPESLRRRTWCRTSFSRSSRRGISSTWPTKFGPSTSTWTSFDVVCSGGRDSTGIATGAAVVGIGVVTAGAARGVGVVKRERVGRFSAKTNRSEEHTSELQSLAYLVCRLLLEKKK